MTNSNEHPYKAHEGTPLWLALNEAVTELVKNKDLVETTRREYVVGYLCQRLTSLPVDLVKSSQE
jgi:hypothetical protein